jgi:hypothetical protein
MLRNQPVPRVLSGRSACAVIALRLPAPRRLRLIGNCVTVVSRRADSLIVPGSSVHSVRRARVLTPRGGTTFASRQALGLAYHLRCSSPEDRAIGRSLRARKKLGVTDDNMLDMAHRPKPKWMGQRTDRRLVGMIRERQEHQVGYLVRRWRHLMC